MNPYPRSAHASIRGYLYQTHLGILRWLDLEEDEVLVFEGDEDLDRLLLGGVGSSEQVKALTNATNLRDRVVLDSLRAFAITYRQLQEAGEDRRFVFTTTAERRAQSTSDLEVDVLASWGDSEKRPQVIAALHRLLPLEGSGRRSEQISETLAWLDADDARWEAFLDAIEWNFEAPDLARVRGKIAARLAARDDAAALPAQDLLDSLVAKVFTLSSHEDPLARRQTARDLCEVLAGLGAQLASWATGPVATRLRKVYADLERLGAILEPPTRPTPDFAPNPGKVLRAAYEVVPFEEAARHTLLEELAAWCDSEDATAGVWLITGEGGSGKTRLMIEWCQRLGHQRWLTGFLAPMRDGHEPDTRPLLEGVAPRLVVVDYAETRLDLVRDLLRDYALRSGGPKLRVVLLARQEADWWRSLAENDDVEDLLHRSRARQIEPLTVSGEPRHLAFRRALEAFGARLDRSLPEDLPEDLPDPALEDPEYDRALYLHMAALATLYGVTVRGAAEALAWTLRHERSFWGREIQRERLDGPKQRELREALARMVTAATLLGGCANRQAALDLARQVVGDPGLVTTTLELLRRLYAAEEGRYLEGLEPDLLGEQLVLEQLEEDSELLDVTLENMDPEQGTQALTVLTRLAQRDPRAVPWIDQALTPRLESLAVPALFVAVSTGDPIGQRLALLLEESDPSDVTTRILEICDQPTFQQSVPLREVAHAATRIALEPRSEEQAPEERARLLNNLGLRLSNLGRREEGLTAAKEATEIYRSLAVDRPEAFLPHLAMSLNNLGNRLSELGRREEALAAAQEATEIYRSLAVDRPEAFLPHLATILSNLARNLSLLGRREEGLAAAQEATEIYRSLAVDRPEAFLPHLAMSLNNLGNRLSELGRREEGLTAAKEATEIYRRLAEERPDAFLPNLAMSLNNLCSSLSELGRREEALAAAEEATEIRRRLAEERPDAFLPGLATSLNNLGGSLSALGRREEALAATEEAIGIRRRLAEERPDAFLPNLATSLNNLSGSLSELGRREEGLTAAKEATEIYRRLAEERPDAFLPDLARSLNNLARNLSLLGRQEEALAALREAVETLGPLFVRLPRAHVPNMGAMIQSYLGLCSHIEQEPDSGLLEPLVAVFETLQQESRERSEAEDPE